MKSMDKMTPHELGNFMRRDLIRAIERDCFRAQVEFWITYLLGRRLKLEGPKK